MYIDTVRSFNAALRGDFVEFGKQRNSYELMPVNISQYSPWVGSN